LDQKFIRLVCSAYAAFQKDHFRFSRATEGSYESMRLRDKLRWAYKFYVRQVERAEKGKRIEEHFAAQDMTFVLPKGFIETARVICTAGGDILPAGHLNPSNMEHFWDDVSGFYSDADIVCANFESPITHSEILAPKSVKSVPVMNNSPEMLDAVLHNKKGINLFSTANNHCFDMGESGLIETLDILDSRGCAHVGTARTKKERDNFPVFEINGIRVAFLSYTFSLNGKRLPDDKPYMANYVRMNLSDCDISPIAGQINTARLERRADFVIVMAHWGVEFESYPTEAVMTTGRRIIESGADIIIGNHPHTAQPLEHLTAIDPFTKRGKHCFIAYALGDLVNHNGRFGNWNLTNIIQFILSSGHINGEPSVCISGFKSLPLYAYSEIKNEICTAHRLLDLRRLAAELRLGENRFGITHNEQEEIFRLERLASVLNLL